MTERRCPFVKPGGNRCRSTSNLNPESGLCLWHDPERERQAEAARKKGGRASARAQRGTVPPGEAPAPPTTLREAAEFAAWAAHAVVTGRIDKATASKVAALLNSFRGSHEKALAEEQLADLRAEVDRLRGGR